MGVLFSFRYFLLFFPLCSFFYQTNKSALSLSLNFARSSNEMCSDFKLEKIPIERSMLNREDTHGGLYTTAASVAHNCELPLSVTESSCRSPALFLPAAPRAASWRAPRWSGAPQRLALSGVTCALAGWSFSEGSFLLYPPALSCQRQVKSSGDSSQASTEARACAQ